MPGFAAGSVAIGTAGSRRYSGADANAYSFTTGPTIDGGGATTTAANSLPVAIDRARGASRGPFTFEDGGMTSLGEAGTTDAADGSWHGGYRDGLSVGRYDCGAWTTSDADRIGGGAFELKTA
jgi:hypothetical protein